MREGKHRPLPKDDDPAGEILLTAVLSVVFAAFVAVFYLVAGYFVYQVIKSDQPVDSIDFPKRPEHLGGEVEECESVPISALDK